MAKAKSLKIQPSDDTRLLLRWSERVLSSDVQDPLGLGLRGSTRLAGRLLHCITSITPRARYFSFIPWCVFHYQQHEAKKAFAKGLVEGMRDREQVLTLGCIAHHKGAPCEGGGLVGSDDAVKWFRKGATKANFNRMDRFTKNPAFGAYLNSLVNLGAFVTEYEAPETDEETVEFSFDDLELSELGLKLAKAYDGQVGKLAVSRMLSERVRVASLPDLAKFGSAGGLCELRRPSSPDRDLLKDLFFCTASNERDDSHFVRRQSLLLILDLCRQFSREGWRLDEVNFAAATYFGRLSDETDKLEILVPSPLEEIAARWRMFQFHRFMGVALEALFAWFAAQAEPKKLAGTTVDELLEVLGGRSLQRELSDLLGVRLKKPFGALSPAEVFAALGVDHGSVTSGLGAELDLRLSTSNPAAEDALEALIRRNKHLYSPVGLAVPLLLLATTLARYSQWNETRYGSWLAQAAENSFLDLLPPIVSAGFSRQFGNWWTIPWSDFARLALSRYVVRQHQSLSYEKSHSSDRCLLLSDGERVVASGTYDRVGMGNPRFRSAVQVLTDLDLLEELDGADVLRPDGKKLLKTAMQGGGQ